MRREEVHLRWEDVDLKAGVIRLADAKTGPRDVMLSRRASRTWGGASGGRRQPFRVPRP